MNILAVDPGSKLGWALLIGDKLESGVEDMGLRLREQPAPDAHPWTPVAGRRGGEICDVCKWAREGHDELKINRLASAVIAAARMHTHHPHARSARCDICTVIDQYDRARRDRSGTMGRA